MIKKNNEIDYEIVELFAKQGEYDKKTNNSFEALKEKYQDSLYIRILNVAANITLTENSQAQQLLEASLKYHKKVIKNTQENIPFVSSLVTYLKNNTDYIPKPVIIDEDTLLDIPCRIISSDERKLIIDSDRLKEDIEVHVQNSYNTGKNFALIFADLDRFKRVNEKYGREAGNKILFKIHEKIAKVDSERSYVYRVGGDEFMAVIVDSSVEDSVNCAKKIRDVAKKIKMPDKSIQLSMRIGVALFGHKELKSTDEILNAVNKAIYKSKVSPNGDVFFYDNVNSVISVEAFEHHNNYNQQKRRVVKGISVNEGYALGKIFVYNDNISNDIDYYSISKDMLHKEMGRINNAVESVKRDLEKMQKIMESEIGVENAKIFEAHRYMLEDKEIIDDLRDDVFKRQINSEIVVRDVFMKWEKRFRNFEEEMIKAKAADIADLGRRIIMKLRGMDHNVLAHLPKDSILFAKNLLPSDTIHLKKQNIKAILTLEAGAGSHSAIIAKALNIPYISNVKCNIDSLKNSDFVIVDAAKGEVIVKPSQKDIDQYNNIYTKNKKEINELIKKSRNLKVFYKGNPIKIKANINSRQDSLITSRMGVDGIGLYRIENIYLSSMVMPDQNMLYKQLRHSLEPVKDKEITLRLLDLGGDKIPVYLSKDDYSFSSLGLRGIRLLKNYPNLLDTQLISAVRLSKDFNVRLMIPMVTTVDDVIFVRQRLEELSKKLPCHKNSPNCGLQVGSMIETPAAAIFIEEILKYSDFISIGTNDLVQYIMAADRELSDVSFYYEKGNEMIFDVIKTVAEKALEKGVECSVCGEIASDENKVKKLLESGVTDFSVSAYKVPYIKNYILNLG